MSGLILPEGAVSEESESIASPAEAAAAEPEGTTAHAETISGKVRSPLALHEGWKVRSLSDALEGTGQQPPWVIENLLLSESATQVSAHPHSMKSLAWLSACLEAPARHTVWDHFDASRVNSSLFIETEDSTWVVEERIRGLATGLAIDKADGVPGFHYLRTGPFDLVNEAERLSEILERYHPDFVVLSTLQNLLAGRAWKEQQDMQDVNALIVRLSAEYCPIVLITHSPWDSRQKRAIGTISQAANFLTALHFEKTITKGEAFVHVTVDSKLGCEESDFTLRLETEGEAVRRFIYEGPGRPKGQAKDAVMDALAENPDATPKEIAEQCGVSQRYVQRLMKESSDPESGDPKPRSKPKPKSKRA